MLLLFKPAVAVTAANIGIVLGLAAAGSVATANLGISIGLNAPTSIELMVSGTPDIHFGLTGISVGFLSGTANLSTALGITAGGGFGEHAAPDIKIGLAGTVGSFFDGGAVATSITFGLSGSATPTAAAAIPVQLGLSGVANVSGGTVTPTSNIPLNFGLMGAAGFVDRATADLVMTLNGTGVVGAVVIPSETIAHISFAPFPDHISFQA